jgi:hypothetical protein
MMPTERPAQKRPSLHFQRSVSADVKDVAPEAGASAAAGGLKLEEQEIGAYLRSRHNMVSMKEFLGAFDTPSKEALKSDRGKNELKIIMRRLKVKIKEDTLTKVAYLVMAH